MDQQEVSAPGGPGKAATGTPGLDDILEGGLDRERLYLVTGEAGAGKSTLGMQFLIEGVRRGEGCLYVSLAETPREVEAIAASHGWSLEGIAIHKVSPATGLGHVQTVFKPADVEMEEVLGPVVEQIERDRPRRVVIDSLTDLRLLAKDDRRFRRELSALKEHVTAREGTILLLSDSSPLAAIGPETFAHGVIQLEVVAFDYGAPRRRLRVRKLRGSPFREGYHDVRLGADGLTVFPQLVAAEHPAVGGDERIGSGVAALDALVGGVTRGMSVLLLGAAGTGKSTMTARWVLAAAERGEAAAVFLFGERRETYLARAAGAGMDLAPYVEAGKVTVHRIDPAQVAPGEFTTCVRNAVEERGARVVVIDPLDGYLVATPGERYLLLYLHELLMYLGLRGVTAIMTLLQRGTFGTGAALDLDVSAVADVLLLLRFFEAGGAVRRAVSVIKNRAGPHGTELCELRFDARGVHVGAPLRQFQGVLTGTPAFLGGAEHLDPAGEYGDGRS